MKRDNINYVVAGGFVLAAGIGLLLMLYAIMGRSGPSDDYHVYYSNVSGMKFGTSVLYEGFRIGQVESLEPEHSAFGTRYRVNLSVTEDWPIRVGSVARATASGLISALEIDISAGAGEGTVTPGSELAGEGRVEIIAALTDAANDFRSLSRDSLKPLAESLKIELTGLMTDLRSLTTDSLRPLIENVGRHIDDPAMFGDIKRLASRLSGVAGRLDGFLTEENLERASTSLGNISVLSGELVQTNRRLQLLFDQDLEQGVTTIVSNIESLSEGLIQSNARLLHFLDEGNEALVRKTLESVATMSDAIASDARAIGEMVDGSTRDRVKGTLASIESLVAEIRATNQNIAALLGPENRAHVASALASTDKLAIELRETNAAAQGFLDGENQAQVKIALSSVGRVASSLEKVAGAIEDVVSVKNTSNVEKILVNVEGATSDMGSLIQNLESTRQRLDTVVTNVDALVDVNGVNLTAATVDLRHTLHVLSTGVGAFSHHLEGTARNLHEFTRQIRENPSLLVTSSPQRDRGRSSQ